MSAAVSIYGQHTTSIECVQERTSVHRSDHSTTGDRNSRKRRYIAVDKRLQHLKKRMEASEISPNDYIIAVAFVVELSIVINTNKLCNKLHLFIV